MESVIEEDRVALHISDNMKRILEFDYQMITKQRKLVNLPAKIPVVTILENFVKYYSIKSICGPISGMDGPRRRNSSAKNEKREKDYEKLKTRQVIITSCSHTSPINLKIFVFDIYSINLRKEVADGLRIYFDFILKDYLLYKYEIEQASTLLSPENLKNFVYVGSEKQ